MIFGYIAAALFLITAAKFITKRLPFTKRGGFLKAHCVLGIALMMVLTAHAAAVWGLVRQRPVGVLITGIVLAACALGAILSRAFSKRLGRRWLIIHRAASALFCVGLIAHIAIGVAGFSAYQKAIASITYRDIKLSQVADGYYEGEYDAAGYIYARVGVTVEDGRIEEVDILEHRNERGAKAEAIADAAVAQQSCYVDAVSGATNSSKVIVKAMENALRQGITKH